MIAKKLGNWLLAKNAHAIAVAFFCALLPVFGIPTGFFAVIIVGLLTLQKGAKTGAAVLAWVALPSIALLVLKRWGLSDVLMLRCVLVFGLAVLLRRRILLRNVLDGVAIAGVLLIIIGHFVHPGLTAWWEAHLTSYINQIIPAGDWKSSFTPAEFAHRLAPIATGLGAFLFLTSAVIELMLARFWQSVITGVPHFAREFSYIRTGYVSIILLLILCIAAASHVAIALDALPIALFPFFWSGLSLMHFVAARKRHFQFVLMAIYVGLFFLPGLIVLILFVIALLDVWVNFRNRVKGVSL